MKVLMILKIGLLPTCTCGEKSDKKFAFICKEFLYGELNTDVQTLDWDNINGRIMLSLKMQNDTIAIVSDPSRFGQLLKLEELQE
ncbi:hypothetical protein [Spiroplasma endosymbiont of Apeira syringaria]|uniref:hypothetical protein n=1 Tax=Spiroplasma endosymbiont of Apeira syringaria TaxID=3066307 RepID=UPI0030D0C872